jgi:hypothetical protein
MDLGNTDSSVPGNAMVPNHGLPFPNVGSVAALAVIVLSPKNTVPIQSRQSLLQSLFERHKESTSKTLQESTASAESKYKFPTDPKGWKILEDKMSVVLESVKEELKTAMIDKTISVLSITSLLIQSSNI